jgi:hypothetical protein
MQHETSKPQRIRRGETRFPGIKRHAQELGVSRPHLFMVLTGQRVSSSLEKKYAALIRRERAILNAA